MSKLLYEIFIVNGSDPSNPNYTAPLVRLRYLGGATGTPKGRIYKTGDAPPAFAPISPSALNVAATPGNTYEVEFSDNVIPVKQLARVNVIPWAGGCFADNITINWLSIFRFSSKVQVDWYGSPAIASSIDNGLTYKSNLWNGTSASAEWSDAELTLLGYTDIIPNIKTRRRYLMNEQSVTSFTEPTNPAYPPETYTRVNMASTAAFNVGDTVDFSPNPNYPSAYVVFKLASYLVIERPFNGNPAGVKVGFATECVTGILNNFFIGNLTFVPLTVTETHSDVTTEGGSDGIITLALAGGSGAFSFLWNDGATSQNRSAIPAGTYHVTVTDNITAQVVELDITINQPAPTPPTEGTFLDVPFMNSLQWVDKTEPADPINNPQALDNRLLCEQEFPGFERTNYFQKVCLADTRILQFYSDYSNFSLELFDYRTLAKVKEFGFVIKEQNIGVPQDFGISIRNHIDNPGQSRVYFQSGPIPIPIKIGEAFTIMNNLDGFDGSYAVVNIINDFTLGYQYLVINKNYTAPGTSSPATGRFFTSTVDFNVFESAMSFAELPEGEYYATLRALNSLGIASGIIWVSEPIELAAVHKKTNLLEYRNKDNAFGITWTTGYIGQIRIESELFKRVPGGERSTNRNADFSLTKINAKKQRIVLFETRYLPPYLHEKLSVAFDCDAWTINKVAFQSTDAYGEPQYIEAFMLANSSIKVEQQNWFSGYNSDDLGTVNEGGFLIHETGFIKL